MDQHPVLTSCAKPLLALLIAGTLCACSVGPDYRAPQLPLPDRWSQATAADGQTPVSSDATLANWWRAFNDPLLDQLVERSLAENKTVKQAFARVKEARAR